MGIATGVLTMSYLSMQAARTFERSVLREKAFDQEIKADQAAGAGDWLLASHLYFDVIQSDSVERKTYVYKPVTWSWDFPFAAPILNSISGHTSMQGRAAIEAEIHGRYALSLEHLGYAEAAKGEWAKALGGPSVHSEGEARDLSVSLQKKGAEFANSNKPKLVDSVGVP